MTAELRLGLTQEEHETDDEDDAPDDDANNLAYTEGVGPANAEHVSQGKYQCDNDADDERDDAYGFGGHCLILLTC